MKISISILNALNREEEVLKVNSTDINYLHIDLMDGKFVKEKQFTPLEITKLNDISTKKIDLHMMVCDPLKYLKKLSLLNIEYVTIHYEIKKDLTKLITQIKKYGFKVGLSIKPNTNIELIYPYLNEIDLVLVMSVEPGYGGQSFIEDSLTKITGLKQYREKHNLNYVIEVDGGINDTNYHKVKEAGADIAVIGSFLTKAGDLEEQLKKIN